MHCPERGTAHVNVIYFVVMLVLFLGAAAFGYVQFGDNTRLAAENTRLAAEQRQNELDLLVRDHYIADVREVIGEVGKYEGRAGFVYLDPNDQPAAGEAAPTVKALDGVALPATIVTTCQTFAHQAGLPESTATPLGSLLSQAKEALEAKDKRIADLEAEKSVLATQISAAQQAVTEADRQKQAEVAKLTQEKDELRQRIDADYAKNTADIANLREGQKKLRDEMDAAKEEAAKQLLAMNKEKNLLLARIDAQTNLTKLVNPPQAPDGSVITASATTDRAWINLGRKDMLPVGTVFQVTAPGKTEPKAHARVTRVDYDRSEVELYDIADRFDPIVKGDEVKNDLYSPNLRRNIVLIGRFSYPLTKPTVKMILEKLGNKVTDKVGPGVDLVLVGGDTLNEEGDGLTDIRESPEYKDAQSLGIEIANLNKVREFLQLGE
jgi:hypothetical protein